MIFKKIVLKNIFSYYGECIFNLEGVTDKKNIALISGRNGFGKTSLLNSIKLLFTGITQELREDVKRHRLPSEKQYLLGTGDDWWGIINNNVNKDNTTCSVEIIWEDSKQEITAKREWIIINNDLSDMVLTVKKESSVLNGEKAQDFISSYLPNEYVPFFFYDGEKIQQLAEANIETTREQIERLLNITHINNLREALEESIKKWTKEGALNKEVESELSKLRDEFNYLDKSIQSIFQRKGDIEYEIFQFNEEKEKLQKKLDSSKIFSSQKDENSIKEKINELSEQRKNLFIDIADELPNDIVFLGNEYLIKNLSYELDKHKNIKINDNSVLIDTLLKSLPEYLFDQPEFPYEKLSNQQKIFFKKKLSKKIESYIKVNNKTEVDKIFNLNISNVRILNKIIQPYIESQLLRQERKQRLEKVKKLSNQLKRLENKRLNISNLSIEEKIFYNETRLNISKNEENLLELNRRLGKIESDKEKLIDKKNIIEKDIRTQEKSLDIQELSRKKIDRAKDFHTFFGHYKDALREKRRKEVEYYLNMYFKKLMKSNNLIHKIKLNNQFEIQYQGKNDNPIGMGNLSAGMKQLSATALIWALKTCSGKPMPIIIDTPIARIDRGNQSNLLEKYYPNVSEQVIILPTDSELDREKYQLLKPYIYREYVLENKDGDKTDAIEESMYQK